MLEETNENRARNFRELSVALSLEYYHANALREISESTVHIHACKADQHTQSRLAIGQTAAFLPPRAISICLGRTRREQKYKTDGSSSSNQENRTEHCTQKVFGFRMAGSFQRPLRHRALAPRGGVFGPVTEPILVTALYRHEKEIPTNGLGRTCTRRERLAVTEPARKRTPLHPRTPHSPG